MTRLTRFAACILVLAAGTLTVRAGDMEPTGAPAPTMITLQDIYDKLQDCCAGTGLYHLAITGQTQCFDNDSGGFHSI